MYVCATADSASWNSPTGVKIKTYQLRDYQKQAVRNAVQYFKKDRSPVVIVLPTGAGKSLVIAELARIARGRVLVLAHVKELVEQNHAKYQSYGLQAGIYSAGLGQKDDQEKVIFGSIQSVARAPNEFFDSFSLLVIDECHRVAEQGETQYQEVIAKLRDKSPELCILGLTATPYRLGLGWIYETSFAGEVKSRAKRFFKHCVFELPLGYMIKHGFLTIPVKVDIPVTCYDFSELTDGDRPYTENEIEKILKGQKRLTPLIIRNIVDIAQRFDRKGVMIFSASVKHAEEVMTYLPSGDARLVLGDTPQDERDQIIEHFKQKRFKYLVNVSVLTTGFDAPHVDVIAILRPTESNALYQQIVGRGLRLSEGKKDCYILDYTGVDHDILTPEIDEKRPAKDTVPVLVQCPVCSFENSFWGYVIDGEVIEHFGRRCRGLTRDEHSFEITPCTFRFRSKICHACGAENDIAAGACKKCSATLVDADAKLKQAKLSKFSHVMTPDRVTFEERTDKHANRYLEIRYYDLDSHFLSEAFFFDTPSSIKRFNINFLRSHLRRPELAIELTSSSEAIKYRALYRLPAFLIARKQDKFWKITEKVFAEEL